MGYQAEAVYFLALMFSVFTGGLSWFHRPDQNVLLYDSVDVTILEEIYQPPPSYVSHFGERVKRSTDVMPKSLHFRIRYGSREQSIRMRRDAFGQNKDGKSDVPAFPVFIIENGRIKRKELQHDKGIALYSNESTGSSFMVRKRSNRADFILNGVFYDGLDQLFLTRDANGGLHQIHKQNGVVDFRNDYISSVNGQGTDGKEKSQERTNLLLSKPHVRSKRQLMHAGENEVQLFMIADNKDYRTWLKYYRQNSTLTQIEMNLYYAFIANSMNVRYSSIKNVDSSFSLKIIISGLLIVNSHKVSTWTEDSLDPVTHCVDASRALESFRLWVKSSRHDLPPSDHWMLFTGFDISTDGNRNVAGLAKLGGMCSLNSVSLIEQDNTGSVGATAAHELGHSLSALHDGEEQDCVDEDNYIMSRKLKTPDEELLASRPWQFSPCSVRSFKKFISESKCTQKTVRGMSVLSTSLSPGQVFSADLQCQLALGNGSYFGRSLQLREGYPSLCRRMWCAVPDDPGFYQGIFALENTSCGDGKWCQKGQCVPDALAPRMEDNCPQGDDPTAPCAQDDCPYYTNRTKLVYCCHTCRRVSTWQDVRSLVVQVVRQIEVSPVTLTPQRSLDVIDTLHESTSASETTTSETHPDTPEPIELSNREHSTAPSIELSNREHSTAPSIELSNREHSTAPSIELSNREHSTAPSIELSNREHSTAPSIELSNREHSTAPSIELSNREHSTAPSIELSKREHSTTPSIELSNREHSTAPSTELSKREHSTAPSIELSNREHSTGPTGHITQSPPLNDRSSITTDTPHMSLSATNVPATVDPELGGDPPLKDKHMSQSPNTVGSSSSTVQQTTDFSTSMSSEYANPSTVASVISTLSSADSVTQSLMPEQPALVTTNVLPTHVTGTPQLTPNIVTRKEDENFPKSFSQEVPGGQEYIDIVSNNGRYTASTTEPATIAVWVTQSASVEKSATLQPTTQTSPRHVLYDIVSESVSSNLTLSSLLSVLISSRNATWQLRKDGQTLGQQTAEMSVSGQSQMSSEAVLSSMPSDKSKNDSFNNDTQRGKARDHNGMPHFLWEIIHRIHGKNQTKNSHQPNHGHITPNQTHTLLSTSDSQTAAVNMSTTPLAVLLNTSTGNIHAQNDSIIHSVNSLLNNASFTQSLESNNLTHIDNHKHIWERFHVKTNKNDKKADFHSVERQPLLNSDELGNQGQAVTGSLQSHDLVKSTLSSEDHISHYNHSESELGKRRDLNVNFNVTTLIPIPKFATNENGSLKLVKMSPEDGRLSDENQTQPSLDPVIFRANDIFKPPITTTSPLTTIINYLLSQSTQMSSTMSFSALSQSTQMPQTITPQTHFQNLQGHSIHDANYRIPERTAPIRPTMNSLGISLPMMVYTQNLHRTRTAPNPNVDSLSPHISNKVQDFDKLQTGQVGNDISQNVNGNPTLSRYQDSLASNTAIDPLPASNDGLRSTQLTITNNIIPKEATASSSITDQVDNGMDHNVQVLNLDSPGTFWTGLNNNAGIQDGSQFLNKPSV